MSLAANYDMFVFPYIKCRPNKMFFFLTQQRKVKPRHRLTTIDRAPFRYPNGSTRASTLARTQRSCQGCALIGQCRPCRGFGSGELCVLVITKIPRKQLIILTELNSLQNCPGWQVPPYACFPLLYAIWYPTYAEHILCAPTSTHIGHSA